MMITYLFIFHEIVFMKNDMNVGGIIHMFSPLERGYSIHFGVGVHVFCYADPFIVHICINIYISQFRTPLQCWDGNLNETSMMGLLIP